MCAIFYASKVIPLGLDTNAETREKAYQTGVAGTQAGTERENLTYQRLLELIAQLSEEQKRQMLEFGLEILAH